MTQAMPAPESVIVRRIKSNSVSGCSFEEHLLWYRVVGQTIVGPSLLSGASAAAPTLVPAPRRYRSVLGKFRLGFSTLYQISNFLELGLELGSYWLSSAFPFHSMCSQHRELFK